MVCWLLGLKISASLLLGTGFPCGFRSAYALVRLEDEISIVDPTSGPALLYFLNAEKLLHYRLLVQSKGPILSSYLSWCHRDISKCICQYSGMHYHCLLASRIEDTHYYSAYKVNRQHDQATWWNDHVQSKLFSFLTVKQNKNMT